VAEKDSFLTPRAAPLFLFFEKGGLLGRLPPFSLLNIVIFFLEKDKITKKFTRKRTGFKGKIS
jgi:hypothetical protein